MQAIINKIVIGEQLSPIVSFENDKIVSIQEETAVSIIGDELFVDQFMPNVRYKVYLRYVFKPTDKDSFITADGLTLCGHYNYDIRTVPYGTKVTFYSNNKIFGIYYVESIDRKGEALYQLNCVSSVGLMTKQVHKGGIYTGQNFSDVVSDILGNEYSYIIADDVAEIQVFGWLPYSSKRKNLHQLLIANGVNIIHDDLGRMIFTYLVNSVPKDIPKSRIYVGGTVNYGKNASRVELTEHSFFYLDNVEPETLFDNSTGDAVSGALVSFGKPVKADSLSTTGNLTVVNAGVNFAYVTGVGVLTGKPYTHTTKILARDNENAVNEKIVTVEEATLVTLANSDNMLSRLAEYYFNATTVKSGVVIENEKCGNRYSLYNGFQEYVNGFMSKKSMQVSSIIKAECEFIADYEPKAYGASYTHMEILTNNSGIWEVPPKVFEKEIPIIRVVCIGKGQDGEAGQNGIDGEDGSGSSGGYGGDGGLGGNAGNGGKVLSMTIDCTGIGSFAYLNNGNDVSFVGGQYNLSSANGFFSGNGFLELFSGTVYALPGIAGQNGAKGGKGGYYSHSDTIKISEDGESLEFEGITYSGGAGAQPVQVNGSVFGISPYLNLFISGGAGGGAAVGNNGGNGITYNLSVGGATPSLGGTGAIGRNANTASQLLGSGGNGGHGGGGGGGGGCIETWNYEYSSVIARTSGKGGKGGKGGNGSSGQRGGIIVYW